jgi:hypothetical protein
MSTLELFFGAGNDLNPAALTGAAADGMQPWIDRWRDGKGPAFLPRVSGGRLWWYGLMDGAPQRREVEQLLQHWVGPSCSDVHRTRGALDLADPFDAELGDELRGRVVRFEVLPARGDDVPGHDAAKQKVRRRLDRLVNLLDARPAVKRRLTSGLGGALDDVYLRASGGDAEGAESLIRDMENRRMLDAPNTAFVRLRARFLAGDDRAVLLSEDLRDLEGQRLTVEVAALVARAAYRAAEDRGEPLVQFVSTLPGHVTGAILQARHGDDVNVDAVLAALGVDGGWARTAPAPDQADAADVGLAAEVAIAPAEYDTAPGPPSAATDVGAGLPDSRELDLGPDLAAESAGALDDDALVPPALSPTTAMDLWFTGDYGALVAQIIADVDPDPRALEFAVLAADALGNQDAVLEVLRLVATAGPRDWHLPGVVDALSRLTASDTDHISSWQAWIEATKAGVTVVSDVVASAIDWSPLDGPGVLRLASAGELGIVTPVLGAFLSVHHDAMTQGERGLVSLPMLEVLALSSRSGKDVRSWSLTLVEDALDAGMSPDDRSQLLELCEILVSEQLSASSIAWSTDLLGLLIDGLAASETESLSQLMRDTFDALRQVRSALQRSDLEAVEGLAEQLGLPVPPDLSSERVDPDAPDTLACYAGKRVLIYSLRERSARQAAVRLRRVPDVDVVLSHDHAGTTQLAGAVQGADVVVIVTAAAKHAATGFIEERVTGDLIRVNSAGASALVRELEAACGSG